MKIIIGNTLEVIDPSEEAVEWCEENLTINNPDYLKKTRMHFWTGNTPRKLSLYENDGFDLTLPFGLLRDLPDFFFTDTEVTNSFSESENVDYGEPVPLYDYQEEAVSAMAENLYGILQSPPGSGKTQMGIALVKKFGKRALWLTHTSDLLKQSKARAEQYIDKSLIGTITEGKINIGKGITFATVQTMNHLDLPSFRDVWDVIIVDECHRCCGTPTSMGLFYKILNNLAARHKIGLSATVHRSDGMIEATYAILGRVMYEVPPEAVGDKILPVTIRRVNTETKLSRECLNTDGTLNYGKMITYLTQDIGRNYAIENEIFKNMDHSCLILSDRLEHLKEIMEILPPELQEDAVMVSGKMTTKKGKAEREQAIEDMRTGKKKYLFATYSLAKEGLDIPRLDRLFLTTPQKDYAVIAQSVGRIARKFEGKDEPICYDFVDSYIPFLEKSWKKRCTTYRKQGCIMEG